MGNQAKTIPKSQAQLEGKHTKIAWDFFFSNVKINSFYLLKQKEKEVQIW